MKMLFVSGSTLLILTTLVLMIVIPIYNSKVDNLARSISGISDKIKEKEFQFRDFQNAEIMIVNMRNMLMLFESSNLQQSKAYNKLKSELYSTRVNSLVLLAAALEIAKDHTEMNQLSSQWKVKPFNELEKVKVTYSISLNKKLNKLLSEQNSLKKDYENETKTRNTINLFGGLLQGIALFLLAWSEYITGFNK